VGDAPTGWQAAACVMLEHIWYLDKMLRLKTLAPIGGLDTINLSMNRSLFGGSCYMFFETEHGCMALIHKLMVMLAGVPIFRDCSPVVLMSVVGHLLGLQVYPRAECVSVHQQSLFISDMDAA
jgi:hypothetical protein